MIQWITKDWGLKLISLVLAIGLWYYAVGEEGIEVTRPVPLEIVVKNPQMSVQKTSARSVQVTFVAPRALLSELASQEIKAVHEIGAELTNAGDYSFRLEPREIKLDSLQIRITKIDPEVIQITLDELIVQKLAIEPNFNGEPAIGYKVNKDEVQLNPNSVLVEGPKGTIEKLQSIKTEKIDLVGRIRSFRRSLGLELPSNLKNLSETLIDIYVPVHEESDERRFDKIPVKILGAPGRSEKVEVTPAEISIDLKGSKKQFEKIATDKILTYVDVASLGPGEHVVPVKLVLPEDISLKEDKPLMVKVSIKK
jgi:YbbR domain-containing protein